MAQFLTQEYSHSTITRTTTTDTSTTTNSLTVDKDELLIINGSSHGLDLICTCFTKPGDTVFVEDPTYFLAIKMLKDHQLNIVGIPVDDEGMRVDILEAKIHELASSSSSSSATNTTVSPSSPASSASSASIPSRPSLIYTIPSFSNPTGTTLSDSRRKKLAQLSETHSLIIASDDVYQLLYYNDQAPSPPVLPFYSDNSISIGSFSKLIGPGLRLGWLHARSALLNKILNLGITSSGGGFNPFTSGIIYSFIQQGFMKSHLTQLRAVYKENLETLATQLCEKLPSECTFYKPTGGYFIWLKLPSGFNCDSLFQYAQSITTETIANKSSSSENGKPDLRVTFENGSGVTFTPGLRCTVSGVNHDRYIRLCFAYYTSEEIKLGVDRLSKLLVSFQLKNSTTQ